MAATIQASAVDIVKVIFYGDVSQLKGPVHQADAAMKMVDATIRQAQRNMLSFGLSALFTGMAVKRVADNAIKALINTYMKATDEQSIFHKEMMALQASFEFLKFSIVDALAQSELFIPLVDFVVGLVNAISSFINQHPNIAKVGLALLGVVSIVSGLLMVIGQATLGVIDLISFMEILGGGAMITKMASLSAFLTGWGPAIIVAASAAIILFSYLSKNPEKAESLYKTLKQISAIFTDDKGILSSVKKLYDGFWDIMNVEGPMEAFLMGITALLRYIAQWIDAIVAGFKVMAKPWDTSRWSDFGNKQWTAMTNGLVDISRDVWKEWNVQEATARASSAAGISGAGIMNPMTYATGGAFGMYPGAAGVSYLANGPAGASAIVPQQVIVQAQEEMINLTRDTNTNISKMVDELQKGMNVTIQVDGTAAGNAIADAIEDAMTVLDRRIIGSTGG